MKKRIRILLSIFLCLGVLFTNQNIVANETETDSSTDVENTDNVQDDNEQSGLSMEESQALIPEQRDALATSENALARVGSPYWKGSAGSRYFYNGYGALVGGAKSTKVIDVSEHNGRIDWQAVKNGKDVDAVIVRLGWGWEGTDLQAARNISELNRLKIPYGVYLYSYARNKSEAVSEARWMKALIKKFKASPSLPIYYDIERWPNGGYKENGKWVACPTTTSQYLQIIPPFLQEMHNSGYKNTHVYSYRSYVQNQLNHSSILKWTSWIAEYGPRLNYNNTYYYGLSGWQYTSSGTVKGINGRVDINAFYNFYGVDTSNTVGAETGKRPTEPTLSYQAKSKYVGWLNRFTELNTAGTTGRGFPLYNLKVTLKNVPNSANLTGKASGAGYGWQTYNHITSKTVLGKDGKAMQQVVFDLKNVAGYRLEYRVHSSNVGWQSWVKEGNVAGVAGKNIEAIEFRLVSDDSIVVNGPQLYYISHSQNIGWGSMMVDSISSGAAGSNRRIESLKIGIDNAEGYKLSGKVHVQNQGWIDYSNISSSTVVGTTGKGLRIEAMAFDLSGVDGYKLQYKVYVKDIGWLDWVDENQIAGTLGSSLQIESFQFRLVPESTAEKTPQIYYRSHIQNIGWQATKKNGEISGTSGKKLRIESLRMVLTNAKEGAKITGKVHVQNEGWKNYSNASNGRILGTTGKARRIEALNFNLTGLPGYKLQYKVHIQNKGWTDWIDGGTTAGTVGKSLRIEAVQFKIVEDK
ncbi:hypothetical protein LJC02_00745 [Breznakia sp. OttesenSCG-928-G09]|nr:hypothetical protein [Breznakia sp. OttesenSCG-928-G09]